MKKNFLISLVLTLFIGVFCITPVFADEISNNLQKTASVAEISTSGNLPNLIGNVIGKVLSFVGIVFFMLMLYGGFLWMQARGNEEYTKNALNTIFGAIIGIIIILASYAITNFIFNSPNASSVSTATPTDCPTGSADMCVGKKVGFSQKLPATGGAKFTAVCYIPDGQTVCWGKATDDSGQTIKPSTGGGEF